LLLGPFVRRYYDVVEGSGALAREGERVVVHYEARWKGVTFMTSRSVSGVPSTTAIPVSSQGDAKPRTLKSDQADKKRGIKHRAGSPNACLMSATVCVEAFAALLASVAAFRKSSAPVDAYSCIMRVCATA
jgi:hypothetical protein